MLTAFYAQWQRYANLVGEIACVWQLWFSVLTCAALHSSEAGWLPFKVQGPSHG